MNGMATEPNLTADNPGTLPGFLSITAGDAFSDTHFDVDAVAQPLEGATSR